MTWRLYSRIRMVKMSVLVGLGFIPTKKRMWKL